MEFETEDVQLLYVCKRRLNFAVGLVGQVLPQS